MEKPGPGQLGGSYSEPCDQRAIVYQRAKLALETRPFGTERNVYANNYEWINHSMMPAHIDGHVTH